MKTTVGKYASYIYVEEWSDEFKPLTTRQLSDDVILDYSKDGKLIGIELLSPLVLELEE